MKEKNIFDASASEVELFLNEVKGVEKIDRSTINPFCLSGQFSWDFLPDEKKEWNHFIKQLMEGKFREYEIALGTEYIEGRKKGKKGVSAQIMEKLRKGEFAIEESIDLHGMNKNEAKEATRKFLMGCHKNRKKCVLIIHGRGKGSKNGTPVLKTNLVKWLMSGSGVGKYVLAFATARKCDGGGGAVYILLDV